MPHVRWVHDDHEIMPSETRILRLDKNLLELQIAKLTQEDSGVHTLSATNEAGSAQLDLMLKVISKISSDVRGR